MKCFITFLLLLISCSGHSSFDWKGQLLAHGVEQNLLDKDYKATIIFSLSTVCPCSTSHMSHLDELVKEFPDFLFIGFHADAYATEMEYRNFKKNYKAQFILINDSDFIFAKELNAVVTPHTFVLDQNQKILYQGAISSSHTFNVKNELYLRDVLKKLNSGDKLNIKDTKPLGCGLNYKGS